jgi:hypothetical protein
VGEEEKRVGGEAEGGKADRHFIISNQRNGSGG